MKRRSVAAIVAGSLLLVGGVSAVNASAVAAAPQCVIDVNTIAECVPDPNLAQAIAIEGGVDTHEVVTQAFIDSLSYVGAYGVDSLEGIQMFTHLEFLSLESGGLTDLSPLSGLRMLDGVDLYEVPVSDLSPLAAISSLTRATASRTQALNDGGLGDRLRDWTLSMFTYPLVSYQRGGSPGGVVLRSGVDARSSLGAASYIIGGSRYTYTFTDGNGQTSDFGLSKNLDDAIGHGSSVAVPRGDQVTSMFGPLERKSVRTVSLNGTILHTNTVTNPTPDPVTTRVYETMDLELNGNDQVPVMSNGVGGFVISDAAMTLHLQPVSGIERAYAGYYRAMSMIRDSLESAIPLDPSSVAESAGVPAGDVVIENVDSGVFYVTPEITLLPGESYTYVFKEGVLAADEDPLVQVEYIDEATNAEVPGDTAQLFQGVSGDSLTLDAGNLAVPAGFEIAPATVLPISVTYGANGTQQVVQVIVRKAVAPVTHTVTFDGNGGSQIAPVVVNDGDSLVVAANPTRAGYAFVGWSSTADGQTSYDMAAPVVTSFTLWAVWKQDDPKPPIKPVDPEPTIKPADPKTPGLVNSGAENGAAGWYAAGAGALLAAGGVLLTLRRRRG